MVKGGFDFLFLPFMLEFFAKIFSDIIHKTLGNIIHINPEA